MPTTYDQTRAETGLLYETGIPGLDAENGQGAELRAADNLGDVLVVSPRPNGMYSAFSMCHVERGDPQAFAFLLGTPERGYALPFSHVVRYARESGVSWVMPTPHCADTYRLALIASELGLNFPSPDLVWAIEDKPTFSGKLAGAGLPVPPSRECESETDIAQAIREIGKLAIVKTAGGHSSLFLRTIDGGRELTDEDRQSIASHVAGRQDKGLAGSVVQESVGDREFGVQALFEVLSDGPRIVWSMTTRKHMVPPFGRMAAHVYDPADMERLELTRDLILPTIRTGLDALLEGSPDMRSAKIGRYALNADIRSDGKLAWWIDGSFRWMPRGQRMANATLGLKAMSEEFPQLASLWARGEAVPDAVFRADLPERAVIARKAYLAGGEVVPTSVPESMRGDEDPFFFAQAPAIGTVLPAPDEEGMGAAIGHFPQAYVDGIDIRDAEKHWRQTVALLGIGVVRNGVLYDYRTA